MQTSTNLPTCLTKDFAPKGHRGSENRSSKLRRIIRDFFKVNFSALMSFTCEEPNLKVFSINLSKDTLNILGNLKYHKLFTSRSEAIRFILLHEYLNKFEGLE